MDQFHAQAAVPHHPRLRMWRYRTESHPQLLSYATPTNWIKVATSLLVTPDTIASATGAPVFDSASCSSGLCEVVSMTLAINCWAPRSYSDHIVSSSGCPICRINDRINAVRLSGIVSGTSLDLTSAHQSCR